MTTKSAFIEREPGDGLQGETALATRHLTVVPPIGGVALEGAVVDEDDNDNQTSQACDPMESVNEETSGNDADTCNDTGAKNDHLSKEDEGLHETDGSTGGYQEVRGSGSRRTTRYTADQLDEFKRPEGFANLFNQHYSQIYQLARKKVGDTDAADVVQEVFIRAWRALQQDKFIGDAKLSTWLHRIAANCSTTHLERRERRLADPVDLVDAVNVYDPNQERRREELELLPFAREQLVERLGRLTPKLRAALVMRTVYDLPYEVIAEKLGITETAAKVRVHRALKRLHEDLRDHDIEL